MATLLTEETINQGALKQINVDALPLIIQNLQQEYQFPIKSFIRETFSNGIDSIRERDVAKKILIDKEPVDKYYINDVKSITKDSVFDSSYYNTEYLSNKQSVDIYYYDQENALTDQIQVIDEGVGLGGNRLKGFFELGYSSKRLNKFTLGKYGTGAKAGLSTGMDYFVMTTRYNGKETSFMIYTHHYSCIVPKEESTYTEVWDVKRELNGEIVDSKEQIYWRDTKEKNGVTITLDIKKHNKNKFITAVNDQLMYFQDKVNFYVKYTWEDEATLQDFKSSILFETDNCVIPSSGNYSQPHLVVNGVNYGKIYWEELDMESKYGNIGVKVDGSEIATNQSRESVKWNDITKQAILNKIIAVTQDVTEHIAKKLEIDNTFEWILEANKVVDDYTIGDPILKAVSGFIDRTSIQLKRPCPLLESDLPVELKGMKIPTILSPNSNLFDLLFSTFNAWVITPSISYNNEFKIDRQKLDSFHKIGSTFVLIGEDDDTLTARLANYIKITYKVSSFIYIRPLHLPIGETDEKDTKQFDFKRWFSLSLLKDTIHYIKDIIVSEDFEKSYSTFTSSQEIAANSEIKTISEKERRKLEQKVFYRTPGIGETRDQYEVCWHNSEATIKQIQETESIIYGYSEDRDILSMLAYLFKNINDYSGAFKYTEYPVVMVSRETAKHFKNHIYIQEYLMIHTDTGFKLGEIFKHYNTALAIKKIFSSLTDSYSLLETHYPAFPDLDKSKILDIVAILKTSTPSMGKVMEKQETKDALLDYLTKAQELHKVVAEGNEEDIKAKSKELFNSDTVLTVEAIDLERVAEAQKIFDEFVIVHDVLYAMGSYYRSVTHVPSVYEKMVTLRKTLKENQLNN